MPSRLRGRAAALPLLACLWVACAEPGPFPELPRKPRRGAAPVVVGDPPAVTRELLAAGAAPGSLAYADQRRLEAAVKALLPVVTGHRWRVAYTDLPLGDYLMLDLLVGEQGDDELAERALWVQVAPWPEGIAANSWEGGELPQLAGFAARGAPGHHLYVHAGGVRVLAVAERGEWTREGAIRELVERLPLAVWAAAGG